MTPNPFYASAGAGSGLSAVSLLEWARNPTTLGAAAFIGSALSTALSWLLARRAEIRRADLEAERDRRAMEREQRYLDRLTELAVTADRSRPPLAYQPDRRADGQAVAAR